MPATASSPIGHTKAPPARTWYVRGYPGLAVPPPPREPFLCVGVGSGVAALIGVWCRRQG
ncbi:hypothetical protein [Streptomyces griseiscabiei]|uniref:hypothetical protein n=1 Tax=Streptomyces griseiscabiei TaxID=2993540 RepID=UPI0015C51A66|nr:hypothetical protein [Streptomyces griseiscabiei]